MSKSLNFDEIYDVFCKYTIAKKVVCTLNSNVTKLKFSIELTIFRFVKKYSGSLIFSFFQYITKFFIDWYDTFRNKTL